MTSKIIIGLAGKLAAGKGTVSDYLIKKKNAVMFRFSGPLREVLDIFDLPITRGNMQNLSTLLRRNFSEDILAKAMVKKAKNSKNKIVIIDGVRRFTDVKNFFKLKNFMLIFIDANQKVRFDRYIKRNENQGDAEMSFDEFVQKDTAEAENQIDSLKEKTHHLIINDTSLDDLYRQIDKILNNQPTSQ